MIFLHPLFSLHLHTVAADSSERSLASRRRPCSLHVRVAVLEQLLTRSVVLA